MAELAIQGATALVTGAGSGIGAALAAALAEAGCKVAVADIDFASAEAVAARLCGKSAAACAVRLDVTDRVAWRDGVARVERAFGAIDILCSNAGVTSACRPITELSPDYFRWVLDVNLMGALHGVQTVVPGMKARGKGAVLVTASMAALSTLPLYGDYCASKHALLALCDALRQEVAEFGIKVSVLCPASVATQLGQTTRKARPASLGDIAADPAAVEQAKAASIASSGAIMSADDVAAMALAAMQRGDFYIPTHANSDQRAKVRALEIDTAFQALRAAGASLHG